jgi:DNA replication and repair protein RecF
VNVGRRAAGQMGCHWVDGPSGQVGVNGWTGPSGQVGLCGGRDDEEGLPMELGGRLSAGSVSALADTLGSVHLTRLALTDFRSYAAVDVPLAPGVTIFSGPNGEGKTNLVEAVGYVATLTSHRSAQDAPLIRAGAEQAIIRAAISTTPSDALVEIELNAGRANRVRLNRTPLSRPRDVLGVLRTVLFAPEDLALVKGDPGERRRFLDDLLVAMAPRYAAVRADYERVLKQRTALLKSAGPKGGRGRSKGVQQSREAVTATLDVWDAHLARTGAELLVAREHLVQAIRPHVERAYLAVAGDGRGPAEISYRRSFEAPAEIPAGGRLAGAADDGPAVHPDVIHRERPAGVAHGGLAAPSAGNHAERASTTDGGPTALPGVNHRERASMSHGERVRAAEKSLRAALLEVRSSELDRGVCLAGPHRDELELSIRGLPARGYASHGESWSLALALRLASFDLLRSGREDPVLILDDVFAELDAGRRDRLAALVATAEQVLVTAAVPADVPAILTGARFTVAAGGLTPAPDATTTDVPAADVPATGLTGADPVGADVTIAVDDTTPDADAPAADAFDADAP